LQGERRAPNNLGRRRRFSKGLVDSMRRRLARISNNLAVSANEQKSRNGQIFNKAATQSVTQGVT
jgi:hypothetical protein